MFSIRAMTTMMAAMVCLAAPLRAEGVYKVGSAVKAFTAKDQFDRTYTFRKGTGFLLVSFDMETGKKANGALTKLGGKYLQSKSAVYVANIHGMPKVGRMFALPKMRKYSHAIVLGDDANLLTPYPRKAERVTVLKLDGAGKIRKISYWDPASEKLDELLK